MARELKAKAFVMVDSDLRSIAPHGGVLETAYDYTAWKTDKFQRPIEEFRSGSGAVSLVMSERQQDKLQSFVKANGHLSDTDFYFVAVETIFPRSDLFYGLTRLTPPLYRSVGDHVEHSPVA